MKKKKLFRKTLSREKKKTTKKDSVNSPKKTELVFIIRKKCYIINMSNLNWKL